MNMVKLFKKIKQNSFNFVKNFKNSKFIKINAFNDFELSKTYLITSATLISGLMEYLYLNKSCRKSCDFKPK